MPFPYSIRTSVRCVVPSSAERALAVVADSLESAGAAVRVLPDGSIAFGIGKRLLGRHWLSGVSDGRVSAQTCASGLVLTARATYLVPVVIGTLVAIPIGALAGPVAAAGAWLWLVGANYVFALLALRSHLKKANENVVSAAT